jgi:hypothetical protein
MEQGRLVLVPVLEQSGVPDPVQVRALAEELELEVVPAPVAAVADVKRLVYVLHEVDEEPERPLPIGARGVAGGQEAAKLGDLRNNAAGLGAEAGVEARLGDRHVDVMPGAALGEVAVVLVGPGRGVGERLARFEQLADRGARGRGQPRFGQPGRNAMPHPAPG